MDDTLGTKSNEIVTYKYCCEKCDYRTSHTAMWKKHLGTAKHRRMTMDDSFVTKSNEKEPLVDRSKVYECACGKRYLYRQGLHKHKASCTYKPSEPVVNTQNEVVGQDKDQVIRDLLQQNAEQQKVIIDLIQRVGSYNTTNSHNTNINFYLNEHCKDAMSIQQFVKRLQIEIDNNPALLCAGKDTKPLLKVISDQLNTLEQKDRPLHSHKKTMYLKDEAAGWNPDKDGKAANTVIGAAKKAELNKLGSMYPRCLENEKDGEKYIQSMSELTRDVTEKERKAFEEMECLVLEVNE